MTVQEFKFKIDNREFWRNYPEEAGIASRKWAEQQNEKKSNVEWSWDCGFKLDYDGDLINVSSRFYPPHKNSADNPIWDGSITVWQRLTKTKITSF